MTDLTEQLHEAAFAQDNRKVSELLDLKADPNKLHFSNAPLHWASRNGSLETLRLLLDRNANVNIANGTRWLPLHFASYFDQRAVVRELIDRRADLNVRSTYGYETPLHLAAQRNCEAIAMMLIDAGADVNMADVRCW
jgi:ankyrin repeat protein